MRALCVARHRYPSVLSAFRWLLALTFLIGWQSLLPPVVAAADVLTAQVGASLDDVTEVNGSLDATSSFWLGNGSVVGSYQGLRFTNVTIPPGSTITSARLQVYSTQNQWISLAFSIAGDASGNSATFTATSRPSQRPTTAAVVNHSDNVNWPANTWQSLDEIKSVVQEIVSRTDWRSGQSLSLIVKGASTGAYARKFAASFDIAPANAARLTVSYEAPTGPAPPTVTLGVSPTAIASGQTATLSWTTTEANTVAIDQGIGVVSGSGSLVVKPGATTTYTITATNSAGSRSASAMVTVAAPAPDATLSVAPAQIAAGQSATMSWTSSGATSVTIDHGIGAVAGSGSLSVSPSSTTTYTLTAVNGSGSTTRTAVLTVTQSGAPTTQVLTSADFVNEVDQQITTDGAEWLGNGSSTTTSYAGIRFANVPIPRGSTITSARLQAYSSQSQWIRYSFSVTADAVGNSSAFSSASLPSQRARTANPVNHNDDVSWAAGTWYTLDEMSAVIQAVVSRPDWQTGNSLSIIAKGTGSGAYARKFISGFDRSAATAPRLVVTFSAPNAGPPPTATISVTPSTIVSGGSSSLSWATTNATAVSINQGVGAVAASGSFSVSPPATTTYTVTGTGPGGAAIQSATLTVKTPAGETFFPVKAGFTDVIPHQIVRSASDLLYVFAASQPYSSSVKAYWTSNPGLPTGAMDFGAGTQVGLAAVPLSISPAYDGTATVHVVANLLNGSVVDVPFDLSTNTFRAARVLAADAATVTGDYEGTSGVSTQIDSSGTLHVAYWAAGDRIMHLAYTYDSGADALTAASSPVRVDASGSARHPSLAVSPRDGSVTVAWVSLATTPKRILARERSSSGVWSAVQNVSNTTVDVWTSSSAGIDIDQGPSLLVTADGTKHLTYIENYDASGDYGRIHYVMNVGAGWVDSMLSTTYSHDPALAVNAAGDLYIIGHGHPKDGSSACTSSDDMCVRKRNADGSWAPSQLFAQHTAGNSFDASPSVKWSVVGWNRPETIEFLFFQTPYDAPTIFYGRIP
jgi:hypothetical protein